MAAARPHLRSPQAAGRPRAPSASGRQRGSPLAAPTMEKSSSCESLGPDPPAARQPSVDSLSSFCTKMGIDSENIKKSQTHLLKLCNSVYIYTGSSFSFLILFFLTYFAATLFV